jgi:hypothetical protein
MNKRIERKNKINSSIFGNLIHESQMRCLLLVTFCLSLCFAAELHMNAESGSDITGCGSTSTPCKSINYAIKVRASTGDILKFQPGQKYLITETIFLDDKKVSLDVVGERAILECAKPGFVGFILRADKEFLSLNNFLVTKCSTEVEGGAFRIREGIANFTNVHFIDNQAKIGGAATFLNSRGNFDNCVFRLNKANANNNGIGGAVYVDGADVNFKKCDFENNFALEKAGALGVREANVIVETSKFTGNSVANVPGGNRHSGAINVDGATKFIVKNSWFQRNRAQTFGAIGGTGIITIQTCHFIENVSSKNDSCAVDIDFGRIVDTDIVKNIGCGLSTASTIVENCRINQNTGVGVMETESLSGITKISNTQVSENEGGGLHFADTEVQMTGMRIENNKGLVFGGVYLRNMKESSFRNSVVRGNRGSRGGGLYLENLTQLHMNNITISLNQADDGAGVYAFRVNSQFSDLTITDNRAKQGGGVYLAEGNTIGLATSTISRNHAENGGGIFCQRSAITGNPTVESNTNSNYACNSCTGCK